MQTSPFVAAHVKPPVEVLLLVKTATYQSQVVCLFLQSLLALCVWGPVLNVTQGTPEVVNQHQGLSRHRSLHSCLK